MLSLFQKPTGATRANRLYAGQAQVSSCLAAGKRKRDVAESAGIFRATDVRLVDYRAGKRAIFAQLRMVE
jgi:hypothetical protein